MLSFFQHNVSKHTPFPGVERNTGLSPMDVDFQWLIVQVRVVEIARHRLHHSSLRKETDILVQELVQHLPLRPQLHLQLEPDVQRVKKAEPWTC